MPTRSYRELREVAHAVWSEDARALNDAAHAHFREIADKQAELGRAIAQARDARSLSQKQLGELSGVNQSEISRIESGRANPTEETLIRLTSALDYRITLEPLAANA
jgi:ribosome-binding protein aMBF1 (putative translation factor)